MTKELTQNSPPATVPSFEGFFTNPTLYHQKRIFNLAFKKWLTIPQECRVELVQMDGAGTVFDPYSLAPFLAFKKVFQEMLGLQLSHQEITGPMGLKKREHIKVLLQKLHHTSTDDLVEQIHDKFTKILDGLIGELSIPTPYLNFSLQFINHVRILKALNTGYSRKTLDIVLSRHAYPFEVTTCADEVENGTRSAMVALNMKKSNVSDFRKVVFFTDAQSDVINLRQAAHHPWIVGISGYSTHVNTASIQGEKEDKKQEVLAKERGFAAQCLSNAHIIIQDLSSLPLVLVAISKAIQDNLSPEKVERLQVEFPTSDYREPIDYGDQLVCRL